MMPVMFELGARPHPPRNLYRAYVQQSHVFVGIYWQEYGWIAPDMEISGVQDEFELAAEMPKLIYIREPASERACRLSELLDKVRDSGVSYKSFTDPEELQGLVSEDLALLLTERFYSAVEGGDRGTQERPRSSLLPIQPTRFIGRQAEIDRVTELLQRDGVRLVTLVGPGGIGKTRLAVEVAGRLEDSFPDGLRFVRLASLTDPTQLPNFLVAALELKENTAAPASALANWIADKDLLLILDNFEQLLDASGVVADLLEHCERSKVVVTSRAVLRIRGEHECPIPPMTLPRDVEGRIARADAVTLFIQRAKEVRPGLTLEGPDLAVVTEICRRLDGLPLAIELGAARMKLLTPIQLLERLGDRLSLLTGGARDLPERQQTLRATIDWSYRLLTEEEKLLLARIAVFRRGSTLKAIEEVCGSGNDLDVFEGIASLVEKSLLRQELVETGEARFWMLETIHEFAVELFEALPDSAPIRDRHAVYYERMCLQAERGSLGPQQHTWMDKIDQDFANVLDGANWIFATDKARGPARLAKMCWALVLFAWVRNRLGDARRAAELLLEIPGLDDVSRAYVLGSGGAAAFWQGDFMAAIPMVAEARDLFEKLDDKLGQGTCLLVLGMVAPELEGPEEAKAKLVHALRLFEAEGDDAWLSLGFTAYCWILMMMGEFAGHEDVYERSVALSRGLGAELTLGMSLGNLGVLRSVQGRHEEAVELQLEALRRLIASGHLGAITYTYINTARVLLPLQENETAAMLLGARDALHARLNVLDLGLMNENRERVEKRLREELGDQAYEAAEERGRTLSVDAAERLIAAKRRAVARA